MKSLHTIILLCYATLWMCTFSYGQTRDLSFGTAGDSHYSDGHDHHLIGLIPVDDNFIAATYVQEGDTTVDYSIRLFKYDLDGSLVASWGDNGILTFDIPGYTQTIARTITLDGDIIRIACEAANSITSKREMTILELNLDGIFNTDFNGSGYRSWSFDNVFQNNIVKYYQKGDHHFLIGNLSRLIDSETNQYPFILKLDANLLPDSSFNETGRLVIDNFRGNTNAKPTHLEGGQAEDIYMNDLDEIIYSGYELLEPYNDEYVCKLDLDGTFLETADLTPYMSLNNKIGIFYNRIILVPEEDDFTLIHSYFTGTKIQFGISQKTEDGQLNYLTTENLDGYHHQLRAYETISEELISVGYQYATSSTNASDDFFVTLLDPKDGTVSSTWSEQFLPEHFSGAEQIIKIDSGTFIIGGFTQQPDSTYRDLLFIKLEVNLINGKLEATATDNSSIVMNPTEKELVFLCESDNVQSWQILNLHRKTMAIGDKRKRSIPSEILSGVYFLQVEFNNGTVRSQRIVIN